MPLKYQKEIDDLKLTIQCPDALDEIGDDLPAFRFCHNPIDINLDFLPNVVYDAIVGITICDYTSANTNEAQKCSRCGASFHLVLQKLIGKWDNMTPANQTNFGYNAIAEGILKQNDGLVKIGGSGHIGFYELDGSTFQTSFKIIKELE